MYSLSPFDDWLFLHHLCLLTECEVVVLWNVPSISSFFFCFICNRSSLLKMWYFSHFPLIDVTGIYVLCTMFAVSTIDCCSILYCSSSKHSCSLQGCSVTRGTVLSWLSWLSGPRRRDSQLRWLEHFNKLSVQFLLSIILLSATLIVLMDDYEEFPVAHAFIYLLCYTYIAYLPFVVILFLHFAVIRTHFALQSVVTGYTLYTPPLFLTIFIVILCFTSSLLSWLALAICYCLTSLTYLLHTCFVSLVSFSFHFIVRLNLFWMMCLNCVLVINIKYSLLFISCCLVARLYVWRLRFWGFVG